MWRSLLEEADIPLEIVMGALGIPLREKELGRRAMYALEALLEDPAADRSRWSLPRGVLARVEALAELLLYLGAEEALKRWVRGYREARRDLGLEP
jgi:hypothetical protein